MSNDNSNLTTKEKILSATIKLYGLKGDMTVREICENAKVNLASVSYHFGSKENLLIEVEKYYSNLLFNIQNKIITDKTKGPKEKLIDWANTLTKFVLEYPALVLLVTNLLIQDENYSPEIISKFLGNMELKTNIKNIIGLLTGADNEEVLNFKYIQLFSGVIGPIIFQMIPNINRNKLFIDLNNKGERGKYIDNLIETIIINKNPPSL